MMYYNIKNIFNMLYKYYKQHKQARKLHEQKGGAEVHRSGPNRVRRQSPPHLGAVAPPPAWGPWPPLRLGAVAPPPDRL